MDDRSNLECTPAEGAPSDETPEILEEIAIEELAIDGICGVY